MGDKRCEEQPLHRNEEEESEDHEAFLQLSQTNEQERQMEDAATESFDRILMLSTDDKIERVTLTPLGNPKPFSAKRIGQV